MKASVFAYMIAKNLRVVVAGASTWEMSGKVMVMRMDSKQRVRTVLEGKMPDRTPLGFYAIDSDTAARILGRPTYWRAKAKCQIAFWEGRRDEVVQSWIVDGIELYKKLDMIGIIPVCCPAAGMPTICYHQLGQGNAMAVALDDDLTFVFETEFGDPLIEPDEDGKAISKPRSVQPMVLEGRPI